MKRNLLAFGPLLLLGALGVPTQLSYLRHSYGDQFVQLPNASSTRLVEEFQRAARALPSRRVLLDTPHVTLGKIQTLHLRGREIFFPAKDLFRNLLPPDGSDFSRDRLLSISAPLDPEVETAARRLLRRREALLLPQVFDLRPGSCRLLADTRLAMPDSENDLTVIVSAPSQSLFNRRHFRSAAARNFAVRPLRELADYLVFVDSECGLHYYLQNILDQPRVSLFQLEPDYFFPGRTMAGIGRYLLLEVVRPSGPVRLVLDLTASLRADGRNELPTPSVIGAERRPLTVAGRGAARLISPPVLPQRIAGRSYLALDLGMDGMSFPDRRSGLMRLYGSSIPRDHRRLVAFARDISLIGDRDYSRLAPPSSLASFPAGLAHRDLEFSGLYEDGWTSEHASVTLTHPPGAASLFLRGSIPAIQSGFETTLTLLLDGREAARRTLSAGAFEITVPSHPGRRRIELRFSAAQRLPAPDNRLAAALLNFLGFQ